MKVFDDLWTNKLLASEDTLETLNFGDVEAAIDILKLDKHQGQANAIIFPDFPKSFSEL